MTVPMTTNSLENENLCYCVREQCSSVGKHFKKIKIENYKAYRPAKDGTATFLHPVGCVLPEKASKGRVQVNGHGARSAATFGPRSCMVKWTRYHMMSFEADGTSATSA